jgi:hypothetical protein
MYPMGAADLWDDDLSPFFSGHPVDMTSSIDEPMRGAPGSAQYGYLDWWDNLSAPPEVFAHFTPNEPSTPIDLAFETEPDDLSDLFPGPPGYLADTPDDPMRDSSGSDFMDFYGDEGPDDLFPSFGGPSGDVTMSMNIPSSTPTDVCPEFKVDPTIEQEIWDAWHGPLLFLPSRFDDVEMRDLELDCEFGDVTATLWES